MNNKALERRIESYKAMENLANQVLPSLPLKDYICNLRFDKKSKPVQLPKGFRKGLKKNFRTLKDNRIINFNKYTKQGLFCDIYLEDEKGIAIIFIDRNPIELQKTILKYNIPLVYNIDSKRKVVSRIAKIDDEIFDDIKGKAISIWESYNDRRAKDNIEYIKNIENFGDSYLAIYDMFDPVDKSRLYNMIINNAKMVLQ